MNRSLRALVIGAAIAAGAIAPIAMQPSVSAQEACPVTSAVQQLSGFGDTVTDPVSVPAGLLTITGEHGGDSNFAVWAYDLNGERDLLFNEIGVYSGQKLIALDQTTTLIFEVTASGQWTMDLTVIQ